MCQMINSFLSLGGKNPSSINENVHVPSHTAVAPTGLLEGGKIKRPEVTVLFFKIYVLESSASKLHPFLKSNGRKRTRSIHAAIIPDFREKILSSHFLNVSRMQINDSGGHFTICWYLFSYT